MSAIRCLVHRLISYATPIQEVISPTTRSHSAQAPRLLHFLGNLRRHSQLLPSMNRSSAHFTDRSSHLLCLTSHWLRSSTHFGVFRRQTGILPTHSLYLPTYFGRLRTRLGVFRKQTGILPTHLLYLPTHFGRSRTHFHYRSRVKSIAEITIGQNTQMHSVDLTTDAMVQSEEW